jgi:hypothetical protein
MTDNDRHEQLLEDYPDSSPKEARKATLGMVSYRRMQIIASDAGVFEQGDTARDLREKLAVEGYFVGAVGDDNVYILGEEGDVEKAANRLD